MNIITKLSVRQKIMLALTVLAAIFLAWQIYNFVHADTPAAMVSAPAPAAPAPVTTVPPPTALRELPPNNPVLTVRQREYLNLVREYQITKMERQILEEKANLASAQKRISDTGRNSSLVGVSGLNNPAYGADNEEYQLAYVDRQAGQWTATLSQGETYKEVKVGTRLDNGTKVLSINGNSVVLKLIKGKKLVLTFQGSVNVDSASASAYTVKSAAVVRKQPPAAVPPTTQVVSPAVPVNKVMNPPPARSNSNNAKIAKMLGITAKPAAPVAGNPAAVPIVTKQQPVAKSPENAPAGSFTIQQPVQPAAPQLAPSKPVSVKELRKNQKETASNDEAVAPPISQISWEQTADLQAAALNKK